MIKNKKRKMILGLGVISILVFTIGVTVAILRYIKEGSIENSITTGNISFLYDEQLGYGNGISITDAVPMSDEEGMKQVGAGKVFNFKVISTTPNKAAIPYTVTAKKIEGTLADDEVKLYITKSMNGVLEKETIGFYGDTEVFPNYKTKTDEKVIYEGRVPSNTSNYEANFTLRMWIDEAVDFSPAIENGSSVSGASPYNGKTFKVKVNVYAGAEKLNPNDEKLEGSAKTDSVTVNGAVINPVNEEEKGYRYEVDLENELTANIEVDTESEDATVTIDKVATPDINAASIQQMSYKKNLKLTPGINYFRVTVKSLNKKDTDKYIIKINLTADASVKNVDSILQGLADSSLTDGYYIFKIKGKSEQYPIHLITLPGGTTITEDTKFGEESDVSRDVDDNRVEASNMVVVKVKGDLTIAEDVTVEPYYNETTGYGGPKGFTLYVEGTLTNNGTIDNSHGAYATGEDVYLWKNGDNDYEYVPAIGGAGGINGGLSGSGSSVSSRATGGGASGKAKWTPGSGSAGTSYSGGTGGASGLRPLGDFADGSPNGGPGGTGANPGNAGGSDGGVGNPGGMGAGVRAPSGTGGLLIIYASSLINEGIISANGTSGRGLGSSGGGSVNIFYKNNVVVGTTSAAGRFIENSRVEGEGTVSVNQFVNDSTDEYTCLNLSLVVKEIYQIYSYSQYTNIDATSTNNADYLTTIQNKLTDGSITRQGAYGAALFLPYRNSYMIFDLPCDANISFASSSYSDSAGASGQKIYFYKLDAEGNYQLYHTLQQLNNTDKYGKHLFTKGTYKMTMDTTSKIGYVQFEEFYLQASKLKKTDF